eukprot:scaffold3107_cov126-Cylindrotheca_fusiformis.AAC.2
MNDKPTNAYVEVTCGSADSSAGRTNRREKKKVVPPSPTITPRSTRVDLNDYRNTNRNRKRKGISILTTDHGAKTAATAAAAAAGWKNKNLDENDDKVSTKREESAEQFESSSEISVSPETHNSDIGDVEDGNSNGGSSSSGGSSSEASNNNNNKTNSDNKCPERRAAKTTECNHVFQKECALEWLKSHSQCPLSRSDVMK